MKYDVLVVEDEDALLQGIVRGLSAVSNLNPVGAGSLAEAIAALDRTPPDLVLTDIRLAGDNGLDLIAELQRRGLRIPLVVMTAYRAAFADQLSNHRGLTVLEKPVPLADLRRIVGERLEAVRETRSDPFDLSDYLQLAGMGRSSLCFDVELENGERGRIEAVDGAVWNAWVEEAEGREALARLVGARCRKVDVARLEKRPRKRQLGAPIASLLLEIAAAADKETELHESGAIPAERATRPIPLPGGAAAQRRCREVMEEAPGALRCRLLEIETAGVVACWPSSADGGEENGGVRVALALFWPRGSAGGVVTEVSVASPAGLELFERVSGSRVLALTTAGGGRPGLAWLALRRAAEHLAVSPPPEPAAPAGAAGGIPLPCEPEPALDRAAARVATGVAGARCCAVVRLGDLTIRGASHPDGPELDDIVLTRAAGLFSIAWSEAGKGEEQAVDEVLISAAHRRYLLARIPGRAWLAALVTDTAVRLPAARLGLRDALPELAAALEGTVAGG